jgi:hypothetical protein
VWHPKTEELVVLQGQAWALGDTEKGQYLGELVAPRRTLWLADLLRLEVFKDEGDTFFVQRDGIGSEVPLEEYFAEREVNQ